MIFNASDTTETSIDVSSVISVLRPCRERRACRAQMSIKESWMLASKPT
jgi:hypothetical protein